MIDRPVVTFEVPGEPVQWKAKGNRANSKGRRTLPPQAKYMEYVGWTARSAMANIPIITGAVNLCAVFNLGRPKAHYDSKGKIKPDHKFDHHVKVPDLTNFIKLLEDALSKIIWVDDCQVISHNGSRKRYVSQGELPGVSIQVFEVK